MGASKKGDAFGSFDEANRLRDFMKIDSKAISVKLSVS